MGEPTDRLVLCLSAGVGQESAAPMIGLSRHCKVVNPGHLRPGFVREPGLRTQQARVILAIVHCDRTWLSRSGEAALSK